MPPSIPPVLAAEGRAARRLLAWGPAWLLLAATLVAIVAAYQTTRPYTVDVGTPRDEAYVRNFHARLQDVDRPYRWSDVYGYVLFPGLGGGRPFTLTLQLDPGRPAPVSVLIDGQVVYTGTLAAGWHNLTLPVHADRAAIVASRDVLVEVRAPGYRTPDAPAEAKGVKVARVGLAPAPGGFITPALAPLGELLVAVLLAYLLVGRALGRPAGAGWARTVALVAATAAAAGLALALAADHVAVAVAAPHLVVTLATTLVLLALLDVLLRRRDWPVAAARGLAGAVAGGFLLRYGGIALPQAVIIDMPYHMKWLRTLLAGDWQSLYFPGGLSAVPPEWGLSVLIPKSPLFYAVFAPLGALPVDLDSAVKWGICFLDATVVLAAAWLARRAGASRPAAALGGAIYAVMPLAFRAFAYGILPTIFGQWLAAACFVALTALAARRWTLAHWLGLLVLLTLTLIAFPTVALFVSLLIVALTLIWPLSDRAWRSRAWRLPALLAAAWALALLAYYGLYVSPVLASVAALMAPRPGGGATVRWPGGLPDLLAWTADYVVSLLPAVLGGLGLALLVARPRAGAGPRRAIWLLAAWATLAPLFVLVNSRVDMIGKHLFFTMLPLAAAGGVALWTLARRSRPGALLAGLALAALAWQAVVFWAARLLAASS